MVGGVPAIPERRMAIPLAFRVPCTLRKSMVRGVRRETCWITAPSLLARTATTALTTRKTSSSAQKSSSRIEPKPGQAEPSGRSNQGVSTARWTS